MCGVVAAFNPNGVDMIVFRKLLVQSMVRGQHATGVSWFEDDEIKTLKEPIRANLFELPKVNTTAIIGHCRYSTSDLEYNQPIAGDDYAIAHNGVVSQLPPEDWAGAYGFNVTGKNDTELLLRSFEHDLHPLQAFPKASIAAAMICNESDGAELGFFRNGQRPLWYEYDEDDNVCWVASTRDIFIRSGLGVNPQRCEAGHHYRVTIKSGYMAYQFVEGFEDLQP